MKGFAISPIKPIHFFATFAILVSFACTLATPAPQADPNAFNTMVAQTALARPTIPPAVTAPPTAVPPTAVPTLPPTPAGPSILVSVTLTLARHMALNLDTQAISGPHTTGNADHYLTTTSLPNMDLLFYAPQSDWQFLVPLNNVRIASPRYPQTLKQANYQDCGDAFAQGVIFGKGNELTSFPLDSSIFGPRGGGPGVYICFVTDKGKLGALTIPDDHPGVPYLSVTYIIWDAALP